MSARQSRIGRQAVSYMLAPATVERLARLADASGLSRGKVIDRAVASLTTCRACDGTGRQAPSHKETDPEWGWTTCPKCKGAGFVT